MKIRRFRSEQVLPRPLDRVFPFFANALNLQKLTPPWLSFEMVTPAPIEMAEDARIDYRLRVRGWPLRWTSRITLWDPPRAFADEQVRGPYRHWQHVHRFEGVGEETRVIDEIEYAVWGGSLVDRWFVAPDIRRIFEYRRQALDREFPPRG